LIIFAQNPATNTVLLSTALSKTLQAWRLRNM